MTPDKPLFVHDGHTFENQAVILDFQQFRRCRFRNCTLVYHGLSPVAAESCEFEDIQWAFAGPVQHVLQFLSAIRSQGPGGLALAESVIAAIRGEQRGGPPPGQAH